MTRWSNAQIKLEFGLLVSVEGGKPENPEKNPQSRNENQQQTQPTYDTRSWNWTQVILVGGKRSPLCSILALTALPACHCPLFLHSTAPGCLGVADFPFAHECRGECCRTVMIYGHPENVSQKPTWFFELPSMFIKFLGLQSDPVGLRASQWL